MDKSPILRDQSSRSARSDETTHAPSARQLAAAIEADELCVHYQPQWSLQTGHLVGVEALVRWERRPGEWLAPTAFIPLAEANGLIVALGAWVIRQAIHDSRHWQELEPDRAIAVSVNVSAHQLEDRGLVEVVRSALADSGLDPADLVLELTESVLVCDSVLAEAVLGELRQLGVRVAIDDFGTGASSLTYLHHFPIDQLKIDRSFVAGIQHGGVDGAIVQNIISLSRALGVEVVAEGIENTDQAKLLASWGCAVAQGYLVSPAVPAEDIGAYLFGTCAPPIAPDDTLIDLTDGVANHRALAHVMSEPISTIVNTLRSIDSHSPPRARDVRVALAAAEKLDRLLGDVSGQPDPGPVLQLG